MKNIVRISAVGLVAVGPLLSVAHAQGNFYSRDKYVSVTARPQAEFNPDPLRVGGLIVNANAEAGITSTSNAFASNTNEKSDTVLRIGARIDTKTDWSNHEIGMQLSASRDEYSDSSDESSTDLRASLRGRLDATKSFSLNGDVFIQDGSEGRTQSANAVGVDRPIEYQRTGASVGANYQADRVRWNASIQIIEEDYEDGQIASGTATFDQDFRDRSVTRFQSRLSYAISPDLAVFGQASTSSSDYDTPQIINGVMRVRDSDTYTVSGGVNFELQTLIRGDISVGYLTEDRKDPTAGDVDGLSVNGNLQWFPSRLTTVGFQVSRDVRDLGLVTSSSAIQTRFGATVDHELRRNVILSAFGRISDNDYNGIDRNEEIIEYGVSGLYKINKRVHVQAFARRIDRDVSTSQVSINNPSFEANVIGIGFKVFP